jgi:DNA adenine methylase
MRDRVRQIQNTANTDYVIAAQPQLAILQNHITTMSASGNPLDSFSHHVSGQKPFLKWPGGKRWMAKSLIYIISQRLIKHYYEPFLGGGAVFFSLLPDMATLSDINIDLINVYKQVRDKPQELIEGLKQLPVTKNAYYHIRDNYGDDLLERAIRFLYLNRTAFGGIYRLNSNGEFNVPYGGGNRTTEILWKTGLIEKASKALKGKELLVSDFGDIIGKAGFGDVVYCDPTYTTSHSNNGFIRYNEKNFSWTDQKRLAYAAKEACRRGALVLVSNADFPPICELYDPIDPRILERKSLVSRNPKCRKQIKEYLFILDPNEI